MQYWLYAFKYGSGNLLMGKYDTLKDAKTGRNKLDKQEFEYADILETEWGREPRLVSSENFEHNKQPQKLKVLTKTPRN